jgi:hypothetical protein
VTLGAVVKEVPPPVMAISILALVLGALGICAGGLGVMGLATQGAMSDVATATMAPSQAEAYRDLMAAAGTYMPVGALLLVCNLLASMGLIAGGALVLAKNATGPKVLLGSFVACIAYDVLAFAWGLIQQWLMADAMDAYMKAVAAGTPGAPPGMEGIMGASMGIGLVVSGLWVLAKLVFYVVGIVQLRGLAPEGA